MRKKVEKRELQNIRAEGRTRDGGGGEQRLNRSCKRGEGGENDGGGGTNIVFLCIQSATSSGKLLAPRVYEPRSPEPEPSLARILNNFCPVQNQTQRVIALNVPKSE